MREREKIGKGREHIVYKARTFPDTVLKLPNKVTLFASVFEENRAKVVQDELLWAQNFVMDTPVVIPPTRIFPFNKGYIIAQTYIQEDNSLDKTTFFKTDVTPSMSLYYKLHPQNFISNNETMYWIDPARGFITRSLEKTLSIKAETYWKLKESIKRKLTKEESVE